MKRKALLIVATPTALLILAYWRADDIGWTVDRASKQLAEVIRKSHLLYSMLRDEPTLPNGLYLWEVR